MSYGQLCTVCSLGEHHVVTGQPNYSSCVLDVYVFLESYEYPLWTVTWKFVQAAAP